MIEISPSCLALTQPACVCMYAAREAQAPTGSWLFGRRDSTSAFADGPPGTPLQTPPPRKPGASSALERSGASRASATPSSAISATRSETAELAALREKVGKLRWLLWSANGEITRLKGGAQAAAPAAGDPGTTTLSGAEQACIFGS